MNNPKTKSFITSNATRMLIFLICISAFASFAFGQKGVRTTKTVESAAPESSVTPIVFEHANTTCKDLNMSTDPRFAQISEDWSLKIGQAANSGAPSGTFPFDQDLFAVPSRTLVGPAHSGASVTFTSANNTARVISFSSQISINAVIIKAGPDSYVYSYLLGTNSDTNLDTGDSRGISHVDFCFGLTGGTTAADAWISGRVLTSNGRAISGARITVVNATTGVTSAVLTSSFGYYSIENLKAGEFYLVNVSSKRYTFAEPTRAISLADNLADADFIANQ